MSNKVSIKIKVNGKEYELLPVEKTRHNICPGCAFNGSCVEQRTPKWHETNLCIRLFANWQEVKNENQ